MTWAVAAAALTAVSAVSSIQQGKQQKQAYKLQASQAQLKAQRDALQYEQAANETYRKLLLTNANAAARGFSGGVQGFSGSAKLIQQVNETRAGRDISVLEENRKSVLSFGEIQANILRDAGEQAERGGYFDAIAKLGTAVYMYDQNAPMTKKTTSTVPVVDRSSVWQPSY